LPVNLPAAIACPVPLALTLRTAQSLYRSYPSGIPWQNEKITFPSRTFPFRCIGESSRGVRIIGKIRLDAITINWYFKGIYQDLTRADPVSIYA